MGSCDDEEEPQQPAAPDVDPGEIASLRLLREAASMMAESDQRMKETRQGMQSRVARVNQIDSLIERLGDSAQHQLLRRLCQERAHLVAVLAGDELLLGELKEAMARDQERLMKSLLSNAG